METKQKKKVDAVERAAEELARLFIFSIDEIISIKNLEKEQYGTKTKIQRN